MNETRTPNYPVQIYRVKSRTTGTVYFLAVPSADTDMVTDGLLLLASTQQAEIHMIYADADEYHLGPYAGAIRRADRENNSQNRHDLVGIGLDLGEASADPSVCRFAFHDVLADGHADAIEAIELQTYLDEGGRIVDRRAEFVG